MKTPKLPEYIIQNGQRIPWNTYAKQKAVESTLKFKAQKTTFTPEKINILALLCMTEEELDPEEPSCVAQVLEEICIAIQDTENYMPETTLPTTPEQPPAAPTDALETLETKDTPEQEKSLDSQEQLILKDALTTQLDNGGYTKLSEVFDFGEGMLNPMVKEGAIDTPMHYGALMGLGADMGKKGIWLLIHGAQGLMVLGKEHVMEQICASLGLNEKTIYNYLTTFPYVTPEARLRLSPTVLTEICTRKYSEDPKENDKAKKELVAEAVEANWDCKEARSHAEHKQGKDRQITDGTSSKRGLRYFHQLPDGTAILTRTQPAYTQGAIIFDMRTLERMVDDGKKIEMVPVLREPSDEEIAASK